MRTHLKLPLFVCLFYAVCLFGNPLRGEAADEACDVSFQHIGDPHSLQEIIHDLSVRFVPVHEAEFLKNLNVPESQISVVSAAMQPYVDPATWTSHRFIDSINAVYKHIHDLPEKTALEKSELMAQFGDKIQPAVGALPQLADRNSANYALALAVSRLETFLPYESTYVADAGRFPFDRANRLVIHPTQMVDFARGYLKVEAPYENINGGLISDFGVLRQMEAHNRWPVFMDPHDVRHIHFAIGHPKAVAAMYTVARSHRAERYGLLSALYEGVDTAQYTRETNICLYFRDTRHMTLEEAMIHVARAPQSELDAIKAAADATSYDKFDSYIQAFSGWKYNYTDASDLLGLSGQGRDRDVENMVDNLFKLQSSDDPEVKRMLLYSNLPKRGGTDWGAAVNNENIIVSGH